MLLLFVFFSQIIFDAHAHPMSKRHLKNMNNYMMFSIPMSNRDVIVVYNHKITTISVLNIIM